LSYIDEYALDLPFFFSAANDSFSAEVLAEAMEAEMKDNSLHHAIFSVYKSGIA